MARFGLLYLRGGQWRERSIVPREWVEESTRSYSGQSGGYGYLWWVAPNGGPHFTSAYFKGRVFSTRYVTDSQFGRLMQLILDARK